jgi:hypothetical protein
LLQGGPLRLHLDPPRAPVFARRMITTIGFDADDTLWHNESIFEATHDRYRALLARWHDAATIDQRLFATEMGNLELYGYGIKAHALSCIETAIDLSGGDIKAAEIREIIAFAKEMLEHPVELLDGAAEVVGPAENCQYALYTLASLVRWLHELGMPDIIHWNNGIHDCGHNPNRAPVQIPLADYLGNLRHILAALRAQTPRVVWATMTPQHPLRPFRSDQWSWRSEEMAAYNAAARQLMEEQGVPVDDLHAVVHRRQDEYLAEDQLHLSAVGQEACAAAVVATLEAQGYLSG